MVLWIEKFREYVCVEREEKIFVEGCREFGVLELFFLGFRRFCFFFGFFSDFVVLK